VIIVFGGKFLIQQSSTINFIFIWYWCFFS